jgi:TetR/AcrR family transcriptional regulator, transcriptional repressor for nem operon
MQDVKQSRALATRERILRAAAGLFALKGFHDTKLKEVLCSAKVTTGAFFHHFQNKDDLGFAVIDRHMERRSRQLNKIEETLPPGPDEGMLTPVFRRLDAIAEMARKREHTKGGCVIGNLSASLSDTHDAFRRRLAACFDEMAREFEPPFAALIQERGLSRRIDAMELARYIVSVIEGAILLARTRGDRQLITRQFAFLKEHLRNCLES